MVHGRHHQKQLLRLRKREERRQLRRRRHPEVQRSAHRSHTAQEAQTRRNTCHAVVVQVLRSVPRENSPTLAPASIPHASSRFVPDLRHDDQLLGGGERDVALIKQMIDVGRQQQAVRTVEPFGVTRVSPRLDMTCFQMPRLVHARDATELFAQKNVGSEYTLTTSRSDKLFSERRSDNASVAIALSVRRLRRALKHGDRRVRIPVRLPDQSDQSVSEGLRYLRKVNGLQAISARLERGELRRQEVGAESPRGPSVGFDC